MDIKSNRRIRFENVAGKRVQGVLDKLEILSNCSNRNNYEFSEDDVRKMFGAIREKLKYTESKYTEQLTKKSRKTFEF
jgi:hypothetical protein